MVERKMKLNFLMGAIELKLLIITADITKNKLMLKG